MGTPPRTRREAPPFRRVAVRRVEELTPHLLRVTMAGPELEGLPVGLPTGNVRVLLPPSGAEEVVVPRWNGNEFLLPDGSRPVIRSYTPRRYDPEALELDIDVVLHEQGVVSAWASAAKPGDPVAVSGTGRGYPIDPEARSFLLGGDESAIPAISVLLEVLPPEVAVEVVVEVSAPDARLDLPAHPGANVSWADLTPGAPRGDALFTAVTSTDLGADTRLWVAGEAAAVQRIRRHLFQERGLPRSQAYVRGYWKKGRAGDDDRDDV
jgi:NADPH-dependent ferric siderophore reductase